MFPEKLKDLRNEKKLTQKELASMLILSKNSICEYEKGRSEPNIETLIKLADILECSIDYLVGRSDDFGLINSETDFDNDEKFLISTYRNLPIDSKKYFLTTAKFLLNGLTKNKN
ncbi:MAG: helix-turn-helix transcriptional regulator [Clostridia bacterium]|nr:helix-turn-helix transcriptional regulator [Clostridia bacterium]